MVTEEVSIVDRGANRRRFLVRKNAAGTPLVEFDVAPSAAGVALCKALEDFVAATKLLDAEDSPQFELPSELLAEAAAFVGQFPGVVPDAPNRMEEGPMEKRSEIRIRQRIASRANRLAARLQRGKFDKAGVNEMQQLLAMMRTMLSRMPKGPMHKSEAGVELVGQDALSALFEHAIAGDPAALDSLDDDEAQDVASDALDAADAVAVARLAEIEATEAAATAPPAPAATATTEEPAAVAEPVEPVVEPAVEAAPVATAPETPSPVADTPAPVVAPVAAPAPAVDAELAKLRAEIAKSNDELRAARVELNKALQTPADRASRPEPTAAPVEDKMESWMFPDNYNDPDARAAYDRAHGKS